MTDADRQRARRRLGGAVLQFEIDDLGTLAGVWPYGDKFLHRECYRLGARQ
jgi:hypothetical protein